MLRVRSPIASLLKYGGATTMLALARVEAAEVAAFHSTPPDGSGDLADGLFYGLLLGIGIYYLFLYFGARFARFGWFALYVLTLVGYNMLQYQDFYRWVGQSSLPSWHWVTLQVLLSTCTAAGIQFGRRFLDLANHCPAWDRRLRYLNYANLALILVMPLASVPSLVELVHLIIILAVTISLCSMAVVRGRQGQRSAWMYLAAFGALTVGLWIDSLNFYFGPFFPEGSFLAWVVRHSYFGGITGEAFIMAFAVAASINEIRLTRDAARADALAQAEEIATVKDNYARDLEKELEIRTSEVNHQNELLLERDHLKSRFFANISHELRTPLSLIQGHVTDIKDRRYGELVAEGDAALDQLLQQSRHIEGRISELLDLSKLETGQLQLHTRATNLSEFVAAQAESFHSLCADKQIDLIVSKPSIDFPPVYIDEDKFQQIIANLLSNAIKFTPSKGQIRIEVVTALGTSPDDGRDRLIGVAVTDTGIGIDPEELTQVFERYYRAAGPRSINPEGSGIGLALVRELTELHGGFVEVESQPEVGSCFRVWVPTGQEHLQASEILTPASPQSTPPRSVVPSVFSSPAAVPVEAPLILLVEDHADLRRWIHDHLALDYRVIEAANGDIGLKLARRHRPDLILSDLMMPDRDGLDLLRAIRTDPKLGRTPCILLTASGDAETKFAGLEARANDYLTKPVQMAELKQRINNLLELRPAPTPATVASPAPNASPSIDTPESRLLAKLREACEDHLADPDFHVAALAAAVSMSEATLRRQIDGLIDRPIGQWIRQIRLERARTLITGRSLQTVSEVAFAVGFKSPSYFSRLYAAEFGSSPLAMLKMQS